MHGWDDILHDPDLWLCTTCYTCQERCPREIEIADAILAIGAIAVHEGIRLPAHRKVSELVLECGHAVPINDSVKEKRERLGMDVLPEDGSQISGSARRGADASQSLRIR